MSLLSGLDDFWLEVSYHPAIRSMAAYNVTSLPEQFEVLHDYDQHDSRADRPTREKGATRLMTVRLSREKREEEMKREYSRFSGLYLAYKTDNSVNIPYTLATDQVHSPIEGELDHAEVEGREIVKER